MIDTQSLSKICYYAARWMTCHPFDLDVDDWHRHEKVKEFKRMLPDVCLLIYQHQEDNDELGIIARKFIKLFGVPE